MHSLGREPQEPEDQTTNEPLKGATENLPSGVTKLAQ